MLELSEVSWGWQETCCGPFEGASTSLTGVVLQGTRCQPRECLLPHPEVSPSFGGSEA